jgi:hypothetical protein
MKTYIVFVDKYIPNQKGFGGKNKTKRFEIQANDIIHACNLAIHKNKGGQVSMFWPK